MNNVPVVVLLLPILISIAHRTGASASGMLMPMGMATLVGGMSTTIGTSTNLLVVSVAADLGMPRFQMFDFIVPAAVAGSAAIAFLWLIAPRILPDPARAALASQAARWPMPSLKASLHNARWVLHIPFHRHALPHGASSTEWARTRRTARCRGDAMCCVRGFVFARRHALKCFLLRCVEGQVSESSDAVTAGGVQGQDRRLITSGQETRHVQYG